MDYLTFIFAVLVLILLVKSKPFRAFFLRYIWIAGIIIISLFIVLFIGLFVLSGGA